MKKHLKYLRYLILHKWHVGRACFRNGLYWQGIIHDWSKFLPSEWVAYADFFYGDDIKDRDAFDRAWLLHQHRNPHHWQHWVLRNDNGTEVALAMPSKYALEMVCDWEGAGMVIAGTRDWPAWFEKNRGKMKLNPNTTLAIELLASIYLNKNGQSK